MKIFRKKLISLSLLTSFLGLFVVPSAYAISCDEDGDGYIVIPNAIMQEVSPNSGYNENGNYSPLEWQEFFNTYKTGQLTDEEICEGLNFKKGAEPSRCDSAVIGANSNVYDPAKQKTPLRGTQVNPGALDKADNGIDEDCDGQDNSLISGNDAGGKQLSNLVDNVITLLSRLVVAVSVVVMIWGGVLYATAAGDEGKTSKARKAIIGAVIGLIVGLLAPMIINLIAANLT